jgi:hypothetical protein
MKGAGTLGVEYDLVDRENYRVFRLGKWFPDFIEREPESLESFVDRALQHFDGLEYAEKMSRRRAALRRIWAFCVVSDWKIVVLADGQSIRERSNLDEEEFPLSEVSLELEDWYEDEPKSPDDLGAKFMIVRYDSERPEDVKAGRTYAVVGSVFERDDDLAPDPLAKRQAEVEAWTSPERTAFLQGRPDVQERWQRLRRAGAIVAAIESFVMAMLDARERGTRADVASTRRVLEEVLSRRLDP